MTSISNNTPIENSLNPNYRGMINEITPENKNKILQEISQVLSENSCPMTFRKLYEVGASVGVNNGQSIRIKALGAGTVGALFTLLTRIARTAGTTLGLPLSIPLSYDRGSRYGLEGEIQHTLNNCADEWKDLSVALACLPIAWAKVLGDPSFLHETFFVPQMNQYLDRASDKVEHSRKVTKAIQNYDDRMSKIKAAWKRATPPPVFDEVRTDKSDTEKDTTDQSDSE
ncbi:MAG: hypothetical protein CMO81_06315 [Waddliaceae bacterium]|nr:hypothetical protein [Waddliaceae bacterium]